MGKLHAGIGSWAQVCRQEHKHAGRGIGMQAEAQACGQGRTHAGRGTGMQAGAHACGQGCTHAGRGAGMRAGAKGYTHIYKAVVHLMAHAAACVV